MKRVLKRIAAHRPLAFFQCTKFQHVLLFILLIASCTVSAQHYDTLVYQDSLHSIKMMAYPVQHKLLLYSKPKTFTFLKNIPRTFALASGESFGKKSVPAWGVILGSSVLLYALDQPIVDGVQEFSNNIGLSGERIYHDLLTFKIGSADINIYQAPGNLNTAIYSIGEGIPPFLIAGGLLAHGLIKNDYRSLSTASQLTQCLLVVGITTQLMKRIAGREVPFTAITPRGVWRPFPGFSEFNINKTKYDAFPSGHMATMMATITVLAENYPEKRWIRPVGYSLMGLVGISMINNGVHWASDYPLAIGIGYVCAKATVKMNRLLRE